MRDKCTLVNSSKLSVIYSILLGCKTHSILISLYGKRAMLLPYKEGNESLVLQRNLVSVYYYKHYQYITVNHTTVAGSERPRSQSLHIRQKRIKIKWFQHHSLLYYCTVYRWFSGVVHGFTSGGQDLGCAFGVAMCKVQARILSISVER